MRVIVKNDLQVQKMREAGKRLAYVHMKILDNIKIGMSTLELDKFCYDYIIETNSKPAFLNYHGFPASACISINDCVIHGIPSKDIIIKDGDIVSLDLGLSYNGYFSDAARTIPVGNVDEKILKLVEVTKQSFFEGIKYASSGNYINEIGTNIEKYVSKFGYSVVEDFAGHGIGQNLHEDPEILNYDMGRNGMKLKKNMTVAIEPMINMGTEEVEILDDGWTVMTCDGMPSAHYENTILITDDEPEILTLEYEGSYV